MRISTSSCTVQNQLPLPGAADSGISRQPELRQPEMKDSAEQPDPESAFRAFINTVERLERLVDQETATLREHRLIALDEFNQKKRHGLLELRRTIGGIRARQFEHFGLDPKSVVTRLRGKLRTNLAMLQTHLDAVAAIAAIIARAIEEQESDGTYTPDDARKVRRQ